MRRILIALVLGLMGLAIAATATETDNYKDKFSSISWGGSDGSRPWSGPWSEIGDDGDEKKGNVRVVSSGNCASGNCMRMSALTTLLGAIGAVRTADTSVLEDASLRFDLKATPSLLGSQLQVQVTGGGGWATVAEYQLGGGVTDHPTIDVSDYGSENFRVRFLFTGLLLSSEAFIDNIEILGTMVEETTTTTSTTTTTTTTPSTTSTTQPPPSTTSTTRSPVTTTTTGGSTDGTAGPPSSTTSTTVSGSSSTTTTTLAGGSGGPGSTLPPTSATTTISTAEGGAGQGSGVGGTVANTSGIRASSRGLQADFQGDLYGDVRAVSSLNGVDVQVDYNMAVEVIESSWAWMVLLGLLVAYSIITGLDRRRRLDA